MVAASEELSSASAGRNAERMLHQVHATSRITRPPRMALPTSARGEHGDEDAAAAPRVAFAAVSAREATTDGDETPPTDPAAQVRKALDTILSSADSFYHYTTPTERAQVRRATCAPDASLERAIQSTPLQSLLTSTAVAAGIGILVGSLVASCMAPSPSLPPPMLRGGAPSSTNRRAVDRMLSYA